MDLRRALEGKMKLEMKPGSEKDQEGLLAETSGRRKAWQGTQMQDTHHSLTCLNGLLWMEDQEFLRELIC